MLERAVVISVIVAVIVLAAMLQLTTPAAIGPLGILVVFILMYVSVLGVLILLLFGGSRMVNRLSRSFTKRTLPSLTIRRSYYFSSVLALAPVMFIGMQSVGEVGIYEVVLVLLFVGIACVYVAKRTS